MYGIASSNERTLFCGIGLVLGAAQSEDRVEDETEQDEAHTKSWGLTEQFGEAQAINDGDEEGEELADDGNEDGLARLSRFAEDAPRCDEGNEQQGKEDDGEIGE